MKRYECLLKSKVKSPNLYGCLLCVSCAKMASTFSYVTNLPLALMSIISKIKIAIFKFEVKYYTYD